MAPLPLPYADAITVLKGPLADLVKFSLDISLWRQPDPTEDLLATTYVYQPPPATFVQLTKYSLREDKSLTETIGAAKTMRENVLKRDGRCWVTKSTLKQTTTDSALEMQWLVGSCTQQSVLDPIFGLTMSRNLDGLVDVYKLGFGRVVGTEIDRLSISGLNTHTPRTPLLHGHRIRPPTPQGGFANLPDGPLPMALFTMCPQTVWNHKELEHIAYPENKLRTEDDDDADWPSAVWDRGREVARLEAEREETTCKFVGSQYFKFSSGMKANTASNAVGTYMYDGSEI
ncbi:hypothetical protein B0H14DRAFT_3153546 [Mycena olivaceomarginata]|nr:hypothetical protein B0H14DRAFT_3153546 [Mycena olivaceomarginata]